MLRDLLRMIVQGKLLSQGEAARKLSLSEATLNVMIDQLVDLGYLENLSENISGDSCSGCPCAGGCHGGCFNGKHGNVWAVTEKGRASVIREDR